MTVLLYPDIDIRVWMGLTDNIQMAKILTDNWHLDPKRARTEVKNLEDVFFVQFFPKD